jgi:hypothetical protein
VWVVSAVFSSACSQLQASGVRISMRRTPSSRTSTSQRGSNGAGSGPMYTNSRPASFCTGYAFWRMRSL